MKRWTFISVLLFIGILVIDGIGQSWAQSVTGVQALRQKTKEGRVMRVIAQLKSPPQGLSSATLRQAQTALMNVMSKTGVTYTKPIEGLPFVVLTVDDQKLDTLVESGQIARVFEDKVNKAYLGESVSLVEAPPVWQAGGTGEGQVVAILDTGVDGSHPFLANKVVAEACFSSTFAENGSTTVCPNNQEEQIGPGAGVPCTHSRCNHGTHVTGIVAGEGDSFTGVAPNSKIIAIQVFSHFIDEPGGPSVCSDVGTVSPCVLTYTSDQIRALQHVISLADQFSIASVNMSLGGGHQTAHCDDDSRKESIDQLRSRGIATIIATGNEDFIDGIGEPACISTAFAVGATTKLDVVPNFSNSSSLVDYLAPGVNILSSVLNGGFERFDGTSMAAPHVAGAWAVIKSHAPEKSVDEIATALELSGKPVKDTRNNVTKPRINVRRAALGGEEVDLSLTMTASAEEGNPGGSLTYSITVTNQSTVEATDVVLTDSLPADTQFNSTSLAECQHTTGTVSCSLGTLGTQDHRTVTIAVDVTESASVPLMNTASVTSTQSDFNPLNNEVTVLTRVVPDGAYCRLLDLDIPDNDQVGISDSLHVPDTTTIQNLKVKVVIDHSWVGDLKATLTHIDSGTSLTLFDRPGVPPGETGNGCGGDNVLGILDDNATTPIESTCANQPPAITGTLQPEEALSVFTGHTLHGEWRLTITDHAGSDTGRLKEWCVIEPAPFSEILIAPPPKKGEIQESDQEDTYNLNVSQTGKYQIVVKGTPQLRISVHHDTDLETPIATNGEGQEDTGTIQVSLMPGTYQVKVTPLDAQQMGAYTIRAEALND